MKSETETFHESLIADLPQEYRSEALGILNASGLQPRDPALAVLRMQQLRAQLDADGKRAQAMLAAKQAEEMDNRIYAVAKLQVSFVFMCLVLAFAAGCLLAGGAFMYGGHMNPEGTAAALGIPMHHEDAQFALLKNCGIQLRIGVTEENVVVGLKGDIQRKQLNESGGEVVLHFRKSP